MPARRHLLLPLSMALAAALLSACASAPQPPVGDEVGIVNMGGWKMVRGYLPPNVAPDSLALLPAPPASGSAAQAADEAAYKTLSALQAGPRGKLATSDADLKFPAAAARFACTLGANVTAQGTPHLYTLLQRTLSDAGLATHKAKVNYLRTRPFAAMNAASCTPASEAQLREDGSYPSGHAAIGWTWALVLTELAPERADALLQRGRAFGQSRGICGVHWQSDIEAGRLVGAATVARLHANAEFRAQLPLAGAEIAAARAAGQVPDTAQCAAEQAVFAESARLAP